MSIDNVKLREAGRLVELEEAGWQQCNNICAKHVEENSSFSALWVEKRVGWPSPANITATVWQSYYWQKNALLLLHDTRCRAAATRCVVPLALL